MISRIMLKRTLRTASYLALTIGSLAATNDRGRGIPGRTLYAIIVASDRTQSGDFVSKFAASDAKRIGADFERRLAAPAKDDSVSRSIAGSLAGVRYNRTTVLTDSEATLPRISAAFLSAINGANSDDIILFIFAGVSRTIADTAHGKSESYLGLGDVRNVMNDSDLAAHGLPTSLLREWMDNIACRRQMIVLEAGDMRTLLPDFIANMVEHNPNAAALTTRDRVILAPRVYGREDGRGGILASTIVSMQRSILGLFTEHAGAVEGELLTTTAKISGDENYANVFREQDFLRLYSTVAARQPARTRGVGPGTDSLAKDPAAFGHNIALLVGTDQYDAAGWPRLSNPIYDVESIARELAGKYAFDTLVIRNATQDDLLTALVNLKEHKFADQDELLIFVAGHGYYDATSGLGFLVTRESKPLAEDRFHRSYLSYNVLGPYIENIPSKHTMVVLDACFGGIFGHLLSQRAASRGPNDEVPSDLRKFVAERLEPRSRLYISAGRKNSVSDGVPGEHSPFAGLFLDALRRNAATASPLTFSKLAAAFDRLTPAPMGGEWGTSEPGGDFLLIPRGQR
jgi:hypothetical protein